MGLFSSFGLSGRNPERMLQRFAKDKRPVIVEIENLGIHFRTVLVVKGSKVVMARPKKLTHRIPDDAWLRVYHSDLPDSGFRMPVVSPHFRLTNGNSAIVAAMPTEMVGGSQREMTRFDTSHLGGIWLAFGEQQRSYAVLDVSRGGCRVQIGTGHPLEELPPDSVLRGGALVLGRPRVMLESVAPRVHLGTTVGCAFTIASGSRSNTIYEHFLNKLEASHDARTLVDPAI